MKKMYIVAIVMIVIAIVILFNSTSEASTYSNFAEASQLDKKVKVIGMLSKDKKIVYDPLIDPNYFSFVMKDNNGEEKKIISGQPKPVDFERSESIVVTGAFNTYGDFVASEILTKCPSKYTDEELNLKES